MSSSADWFSRQLGQPQQQPRQSTPTEPAPQRGPYIPQRPTGTNNPNIKVTSENIMEAAGQWQGGEAHRKETEDCPNCGSDLYFSRSNSDKSKVYTQNGVMNAAKHCYACGYPNQQTGSM